MRLRASLAFTSLAALAGLSLGVTPSSAATKSCPAIPAAKITALKATNATCGQAKTVAKAWNNACEEISSEYFCDPKSLKARSEKPIKVKGYKCTATETSRTATRARHKVTCKKSKAKVTFKHLATRAS